MRVSKSQTLEVAQGFSTRSIVTRSAVVVAVLASSLWLLAGQTQGLDLVDISAAVARIPLLSLLAALVFTGLSLWSVAAYDRQAYRVLRMRPEKTALRTGYTATAISQTLGFGLVIGTLVRWRCYAARGVSMPQAAALTGVICIGFMGCLALLLGLSTLVHPIKGVAVPSFVILGVGLAVMALSLTQKSLRMGGFRLAVPTPSILGRFFMLTVLDTGFAAAALWILLPAEMRPEFALFAQVFLLCLGLGLLSSTPGGLGVFEVTCLMILKDIPQAELLSAILVFRAIYYAVPFLLAAALLMETERTRRAMPAEAQGPVVERDPSIVPAWLVATSPQAEASLAYLGDKEFLVGPQKHGAVMYARGGTSLVALGDPLGAQGGEAETLLRRFGYKAALDGFTPVIYRASQAHAERAERLGWHARLQGQEAVVDPQSFEAVGKNFRELKRKLKQAVSGGVEVEVYAPGRAPMEQLAEVADAWKARHGGVELGFSQGRFEPVYLERQHIVTAVVEGRIVGFISLWVSGDGQEMSLDLMRSYDDIPQGTMHLLVHEGIGIARAAGCTRFSLCAVQLRGLEHETSLFGRLGHWIYEALNNRHHLQGLARFKQAFRPDWEPRYLVTRSRAIPIKAIWDIHCLIRAKA